MSSLKSFLSRFNLLSVIFILIVTLYSIGKTINYFFFTDDYATLSLVQQGKSWQWPYQYLTAFFTPFYKLFGTNPTGYFGIAIFTYFVAGISVFFLLFTLTKNKWIAMLSALIFATGYIGLDQFTQTAVVTVNNINNILVSLALICFIKWTDTKKLKYYFLSLVIFWVDISTISYRAFPLILFIPTIYAFFSINFKSAKRIGRDILLGFMYTFPFLFLAFKNGIFSYGSSQPQAINATSIMSLVNRFTHFFSISVIYEEFSLLGKFILLEPIVRTVWFYPREIPYFVGGVFIFSAIIIFSEILILLKIHTRVNKSLIVLALMVLESYVGVIAFMNYSNVGVVNRYLSITAVCFSGLMPIGFFLIFDLFSKFFNKKWILYLFPLFIIPFIYTMSNLSIKYEEQFVSEGKAAREYYFQLKKFVPEIGRGSIFLFDHANYYPVNSNFGYIAQSAVMNKEVNLAFIYNIPITDLKIADDFNDLINLINSGNISLNKIHTFYYDEKGLRDTTEKTIQQLRYGDKAEAQLKDRQTTSKDLSNIEVSDIDISSFTPGYLSFSLSASSDSVSSVNLPYSYQLNVARISLKKLREIYKNTNKAEVFNYLSAKKRYYDNVRVDVTSQDKSYPKEHLVDGDLNKSWVSYVSDWESGIKPIINIDLGEEKNVGRITWGQIASRIPSDYSIEASIDGRNWRKLSIKTTVIDLGVNKVAVEDFPALNARYIRFKIYQTLNGFVPSISEIEVIEAQYRDVDLSMAKRVEENPLEFIENETALSDAISYLKNSAYLSVVIETDKDENINSSYKTKVPIFIDGLIHNYEVSFPAGGTKIKKIILNANFPANINLFNMQILHNPLLTK